MSQNVSLLPETQGGAPQPGTAGWRFSVIPPKAVRARWYRRATGLRRPAGTLALPAIATTAALYFTRTLHDSDTAMAFGLTTLTVAYDAVIALCRTWRETAQHRHHHTGPKRRAA
ncbi:hypothetical protein AB0G32_07280 [Streptomyces sp. NPDC023723]|uniref:hypothetical protein n=1 Tax=Streptomyces sp. NPDC023723 TaxID=3154323 RepID=UPI0033E5D9BC